MLNTKCISGKWRTSSYPVTNKPKKLVLRMCQKHEKSEVPDIIEGVPVCSGDHTRTTKRYNNTQTDLGRDEGEKPDRYTYKNFYASFHVNLSVLI